MKREGRVKLYMSKVISKGKLDSFTAVVSLKDADAKKRMYEQMGYKVRKIF